MANQERDERLVTGEPLETPEGVRVPAQQNVGYGVEEGGGEWPDPNTEPQLPAPGGAEEAERSWPPAMQPARPAPESRSPAAPQPPLESRKPPAARPEETPTRPAPPPPAEHGHAEDAQFGTAFNVLAAFEQEQTARSAADRLVREGLPSSAIRVSRPGEGNGDMWAEQRAEIQDELDESWGGPSIGLFTKAQAKGAVVGTAALTLAGVIVGILGGLVWAILSDSALGSVGQVVVAAVIAGIAGATVGFLAGGGLQPRREAAGDSTRGLDDQRLPAERDVLVAVHVDEPGLAEQAAGSLRTLGADRVHLVDAAGTPLPRQSEHPRPADPQGWWWKRAGQG